MGGKYARPIAGTADTPRRNERSLQASFKQTNQSEKLGDSRPPELDVTEALFRPKFITVPRKSVGNGRIVEPRATTSCAAAEDS
jgi:hypothetical protein